jgi:hypothetical protein
MMAPPVTAPTVQLVAKVNPRSFAAILEELVPQLLVVIQLLYLQLPKAGYLWDLT